MTDLLERPLGALRTPPEILAKAWDGRMLLAAVPTALDPRPAFHSPRCPATVDQISGSCVAYSGFYVQSGQEVADEGHLLTTRNIDPYATYLRVKAETGDPTDATPGLYPQQFWASIKARGWVTLDGIPRTIDAYYGFGRPSPDVAWLALMQAAIDELGPLQVASGWDKAWFVTDALGFLRTPLDVSAGGHAYVLCGWGTFGGLVYPLGHQTWGFGWGHNPVPEHFSIDPRFWTRPNQWTEAWHVTDKLDAPTPAPVEAPVIVTDPTPKLVDLPLGRQLFKPDGTTPLVRMNAAATDVYSPAGGPTTSHRYVVITTGGVRQLAAVGTFGLVFRPFAGDVKHNIALTVDGVVKYGGTL